MYFIDTHCHLDFFDNPDAVINRATAAGVKQFILPTVSSSSLKKSLQIIKETENVFLALGIHPSEINNQAMSANYWTYLEEILKDPKNRVVAIGETGLDFSGDNSNEEKELQITLFKKHLQLALTYHLPLIIHNRKAGPLLLELLSKGNQSCNVVFHCFTGSKIFLKLLVNKGYYIGVGGLVTADTGLEEVIKTAPLNQIVLETDAPYLTPMPVKEKISWPNEPANLIYSAQKLALIKNTSLEEVASVTTSNTCKVFSLPYPNQV